MLAGVIDFLKQDVGHGYRSELGIGCVTQLYGPLQAIGERLDLGGEAYQFENWGFGLYPAGEAGGSPTTVSHPLAYLVSAHTAFCIPFA